MRSTRNAACLLGLLLPLTAAAVPVTYEFTGVVNNFNHSGDDIFMPPPIPFGTTFAGSFTLEDSTPVYSQATGYVTYRGVVTAAQLSFDGGGAGSFEYVGATLPNVGSGSYLTFINDLEYLGNPPYDQFNFGTSVNLLPGDAAGTSRGFSLYYGSFDTNLLPAGLTIADPLPVANLLAAGVGFGFDLQEFDANGNPAFTSSLGGALTSLTQVQTSVPEPSTLALLAAGLLGLGARRRRLA
jgi:hypothetical protein